MSEWTRNDPEQPAQFVWYYRRNLYKDRPVLLAVFEQDGVLSVSEYVRGDGTPLHDVPPGYWLELIVPTPPKEEQP